MRKGVFCNTKRWSFNTSEDIDWQGWQKTEHVDTLLWLPFKIEKKIYIIGKSKPVFRINCLDKIWNKSYYNRRILNCCHPIGIDHCTNFVRFLVDTLHNFLPCVAHNWPFLLPEKLEMKYTNFLLVKNVFILESHNF